MDVFERRWRLIESLLTGPKTRKQLITELGPLTEDEQGLSSSSVTGDVNALRAMGIGFSPLEPGTKRSRQAYSLDFERLPLWGSREDAHALLAAEDVLSRLNLPEAERLARLISRLPSAVREGLREPYSHRLLAASATTYDPEVFQVLKRGIANGWTMEISYQPMGKPARRYRIDRAYLTWLDGGLYLHAHCPDEPGAQKVLKNREFRLDRFVRLEGRSAVFLHEKNHVAEKEFPTFDLLLEVAPAFAARFNPIKDQVWVLEDAKGRKLVRLRETMVLRAVRRVLSYGEQVRVLEPDFVREELQRTLGRMTELLADGKISGDGLF